MLRRTLQSSKVVAASGFTVTPTPLINHSEIGLLKKSLPTLYGGDFASKQYPDEWHYRPGFSKEDVTREVCNAWKSSPTIASLVLSPHIAEYVAKFMGWRSIRVGQDDVIQKPKSEVSNVGWHRDYSYINSNFVGGDGCTVWISLDRATEENGGVKYAVGSQEWPMEPLRDGVDSAFMSGASDPLAYLRRYALGDIEIACPEVDPGHAIIHQSKVFHGSSNNGSADNMREAIVVHFVEGDCQWKETESTLPWGDAGYIYGRYRRAGEVELAEDHFPITWSENEAEITGWVKDYIGNGMGMK